MKENRSLRLSLVNFVVTKNYPPSDYSSPTIEADIWLVTDGNIPVPAYQTIEFGVGRREQQVKC